MSSVYPRAFVFPSHSPELIGKMLDYSSTMLISIQDTALHLHHRRPWARAFTSTAVKEYSALVAKRTLQLVSCLEQQQGVIHLDKWIDYFTSVPSSPARISHPSHMYT